MQQLKSMTGYGSAQATIENWIIKIEIAAVNGKYADLKFRLPKDLQEKEYEWRNMLSKRIVRGTAQVSITLEEIAGIHQRPKALINKEVFNSYTSQIRSLMKDHDLDPSHLLPFIVNLPGVQLGVDERVVAELHEQITKCLMNALEQFDKHRLAEGAALGAQMSQSIETIKKRNQQVEAIEPQRNEAIKERLNGQVKKWGEDIKIEQDRLAAEILFYLDKMDIAEEKTRLTQHCSYFLDSLNELNAGKKLGFICQEMGREINTMGNKVNYFEMQKLCVEMKEELEKIKEQVLNIL